MLIITLVALSATFPAISSADIPDEEIIESVKKDTGARNRVLEVFSPATPGNEKAVEETFKQSECFVVPLESQCGVAGCGGTKLVIIRHTKKGTNPGSRYIPVLVRVMNGKIRGISPAKITSEQK
jgi:hypothetical protein